MFGDDNIFSSGSADAWSRNAGSERMLALYFVPGHAEIPTSCKWVTGLKCVGDSDSTWNLNLTSDDAKKYQQINR